MALEQTKIWKSPHRQDYIMMVRNGWSAEKIKAEAAMMGEKFSDTAIENFRKSMFISTDKEWRYFGKKFEEIDRFIDVTKEYVDLIQMQKERIETFLDAEQKIKIGLPETRHNIEMLKNLYEDYVKVKQMLGQIPTPVAGQSVVTSDTKATVYNLLKEARRKILSQKEPVPQKIETEA